MPEPVRKAADRDWDPPKRKKCARVHTPKGCWRSEERFHTRRGVAESEVCPSGFQTCFGPVFPHCAPFPMLRIGNAYNVIIRCMLEVRDLFPIVIF